ncbi:4-alpha-glucanotransferase [Microgenomates group bacterium]|nr:4-alpha-glucanotransferase [Microgenomates group bacterium]
MLSGIITFLPLSSLKNTHDAHLFLDWLAKRKQRGWLQSPISAPLLMPYKNNGIGISPDLLEDIDAAPRPISPSERQQFLAQNASWLPDFALYHALSEHFRCPQWWLWPENIKKRAPKSLAYYQTKLAPLINAIINQQYQLFTKLSSLRQAATAKGLSLIGDLPFYIAHHSPLVWAHQNAFVLSAKGELDVVSGIAAKSNDIFGEQVWGHPLYNWSSHQEEVLTIFRLRLAFMAQFYDLIRLDHADGFFHHGAIYPATPEKNTILSGPGREALVSVLNFARKHSLDIFLDDIGADTSELHHLMDDQGLFGTNILTLASFANQHLLDISAYPPHKVAFSSTHDTPPLLSWLENLSPDLKHQLKVANHLPEELSDPDLAATLRDRLAQLSSSHLVIIPWQDWHLETWRFNIPGRENESHWEHKVKIAYNPQKESLV